VDTNISPQRKAVKAIDQALAKSQKKVVDQPNPDPKHPTVRKPRKEKVPKAKPRPELDAPGVVETGRVFASSSTQGSSINAIPRPPATLPHPGSVNDRGPRPIADTAFRPTLNSTAGPSHKRPSPFNDIPSTVKKSKKAGKTLCAICGNSPSHLIKSCPLVVAGPTRWVYLVELRHSELKYTAISVSEVIRKLEQVPSMNDTVDVLRRILAKQMSKETAKLMMKEMAKLQRDN
jgi:predicted CopG family antitoxin